jgi:hypothetical protein
MLVLTNMLPYCLSCLLAKDLHLTLLRCFVFVLVLLLTPALLLEYQLWMLVEMMALSQD